jgi:hypothetical protein
MKPLWASVNWILQRTFPKTWDRSVHRVATERGITDEQVLASLKTGEPPAPRNPYPG